MGSKALVSVIGIIGIILLMLLFPSFMSGVVETQTNNITNSYNVSTNATTTTAVLTLAQPLFNDDRQNVMQLSSDGGGGDNPLTTSYATVSRQLSISGLDASKTRNVTVGYRTDALQSYQGISTVMPVLPMVGMFAVLVIIIALMYRAWS